jgi:hypothetical protein
LSSYLFQVKGQSNWRPLGRSLDSNPYPQKSQIAFCRKRSGALSMAAAKASPVRRISRARPALQISPDAPKTQYKEKVEGRIWSRQRRQAVRSLIVCLPRSLFAAPNGGFTNYSQSWKNPPAGSEPHRTAALPSGPCVFVHGSAKLPPPRQAFSRWRDTTGEAKMAPISERRILPA